MKSNKNFLIGVYNDEDTLMNGIRKVRDSGIKITEVYSPFPIHGIEAALGYKTSRLSIVAFLFGLTGTCLALIAQIGMMTVDWPMVIGGKDFLPFPTFIPVAFELTVLFAAFGMVGTFFVVSNLKPWGKPRIYDIRITDNKHVMVVDLAKNSMNEADIQNILKESGTSEVNNKNFK